MFRCRVIIFFVEAAKNFPPPQKKTNNNKSPMFFHPNLFPQFSSLKFFHPFVSHPKENPNKTDHNNPTVHAFHPTGSAFMDLERSIKLSEPWNGW